MNDKSRIDLSRECVKDKVHLLSILLSLILSCFLVCHSSNRIVFLVLHFLLLRFCLLRKRIKCYVTL